MSEQQFFKTRIGQVYFQETVSRIAKALERIANALEIKSLEKKSIKEKGELITSAHRKGNVDKLILAIIYQITEDIEGENTEALYKLLSDLPDKNLINYLSKQEKKKLCKQKERCLLRNMNVLIVDY